MAKLKISEMPLANIESTDVLPFVRIGTDGEPNLNRAIQFQAFLAIVLANLPGGGGNTGPVDWGDIGGNITDQTDLAQVLSDLYPANNPANFQTNTQVASTISSALANYVTTTLLSQLNYQNAMQVGNAIAAALGPYATQNWVNSQGFITNVISALGYTPENTANKENTVIDNSTTKFPTNALVKSSLQSLETTLRQYAESLVVGLWDDRGAYNPSSGNYPTTGGSGLAGAILKGDVWTISANGTLPTGQAVEVGDLVRALVDSPGNTQANWAITQNNIGYIAENISNKVTSLASPNNTTYPTSQTVADELATKAAKTQVDYISGIVEAPANTTYTLVLNSPIGGTITQTTTRSDSGTCTATWAVNGTTLANTNAVSSALNVQSQSQAFVAGDRITLTVTANSSCQNLQFTLRYNTTLQ